MPKSALTALFLSLVVGQGFYPDLLLATSDPSLEDNSSNQDRFFSNNLPLVFSEQALSTNRIVLTFADENELTTFSFSPSTPLVQRSPLAHQKPFLPEVSLHCLVSYIESQEFDIVSPHKEGFLGFIDPKADSPNFLLQYQSSSLIFEPADSVFEIVSFAILPSPKVQLQKAYSDSLPTPLTIKINNKLIVIDSAVPQKESTVQPNLSSGDVFSPFVAQNLSLIFDIEHDAFFLIQTPHSSSPEKISFNHIVVIETFTTCESIILTDDRGFSFTQLPVPESALSHHNQSLLQWKSSDTSSHSLIIYLDKPQMNSLYAISHPSIDLLKTSAQSSLLVPSGVSYKALSLSMPHASQVKPAKESESSSDFIVSSTDWQKTRSCSLKKMSHPILTEDSFEFSKYQLPLIAKSSLPSPSIYLVSNSPIKCSYTPLYSSNLSINASKELTEAPFIVFSFHSLPSDHSSPLHMGIGLQTETMQLATSILLNRKSSIRYFPSHSLDSITPRFSAVSVFSNKSLPTPVKNEVPLADFQKEMYVTFHRYISSYNSFIPTETKIEEYLAFSLNLSTCSLPKTIGTAPSFAYLLKGSINDTKDIQGFTVEQSAEEFVATLGITSCSFEVASPQLSTVVAPFCLDQDLMPTAGSDLPRHNQKFILLAQIDPPLETSFTVQSLEKINVVFSPVEFAENTDYTLSDLLFPLLLSDLSKTDTQGTYDDLVESSYKQFSKTIFLANSIHYAASTENSHWMNNKHRVLCYELSQIPSLEELGTYNFSEEFIKKIQIAAKPDGSGYYFALELKPISAERLTPIRQNVYFVIDKNKTTDKYLYESYVTSIRQTLPYIYSDDAFNVYVFDGAFQKMEAEPGYHQENSDEKVERFLTKQAQSFRYSSKNINVILEDLYRIASNYPNDVNTVILFTNGASLYSASKENQENIYSKLPAFAKTYSIYPATITKSSNLRGLEKLSEIYRGKVISSSTYSGLPRHVGKQVKQLQRPVVKNLLVTPLTKGKQTVKIFPSPHNFPEIFSNTSTVIYGFTNSIQAFELFLQGSIQDEWMNARVKIHIDSAENGGSHLRKKCMALESKAKHLSQL